VWAGFFIDKKPPDLIFLSEQGTGGHRANIFPAPGERSEKIVVIWLVLITSVVIAAGTLWLLKRRHKRNSGLELTIDPESEGSFYPEIEKCHEINTRSITCSCQDFREGREQFRHDDPRRLCKHLVRSFVDAGSLPEDLMRYKEGIEQSAEDHAGFPSDGKMFDTLVRGETVSIMIRKEASEEEPWTDVYYEAKRYRYSPALDKWVKETVPPYEGEIIRFLYEKIGKPIPDARLKSIQTLSCVQTEKREKEGKNAEEESERFCLLESVLRTLLPPDGDLALKETKSYVAVTFGGSRRWMCRFYLKSAKSKYIEFPDGRRYELNVIGDIAHYREQLIDAYHARSPKKGKSRMLFPANEKIPSRYNVSSVESRDRAHLFSRN
jgi:hypothetical protein